MIAPRDSWNLPVKPAPLTEHEPQPPVSSLKWLADLDSQFGSTLRAMLRQKLGNTDDADDVYQECLFRLAKIGGTINLRSVRAYAYRAATNLAIELIRRRECRSAHWDAVVTDQRARRDDTRQIDPAHKFENEPQSPQAKGRFSRAVGGLPRHLREVIVLRDLSQMPYRKVAAILGIQPTTARVYRRQAVVRLGAALGEPI